MKNNPKCCVCDSITTTYDESVRMGLENDVSIFCSFGKKRVCVVCALKIYEMMAPKKEKFVSKKKPIPGGLRWEVWARDNFTCLICGAREHLSIDHIYPESMGGGMDIGNLQTLCITCNKRKGVSVGAINGK